MTQPTKDKSIPNRVRMSGNRSASTRSRATEADRMRARRRKPRRSPAFAIVCVVLLLIIAIGGALMYASSRPKQQAEETYPLQYTETVTAAAEEFDLEPAYLYAVILAESSFRPGAESNVGALGLMQVMPDTGAWIAKKLDMADSYTVEMLTDPATNVRFGAWYLRFLLDRYDGDKRCASAAYHAGQGTVDNWLADPSCSPDGVTLAVIAYDSTNNYVNKVMKYYEAYLALLS